MRGGLLAFYGPLGDRRVLAQAPTHAHTEREERRGEERIDDHVACPTTHHTRFLHTDVRLGEDAVDATAQERQQAAQKRRSGREGYSMRRRRVVVGQIVKSTHTDTHRDTCTSIRIRLRV